MIGMKARIGFFAAAVAAGTAFAAGDVFRPLDRPVAFAEAESVWPKGMERTMNAFVEFRASFDAPTDCTSAILRIAAYSAYRITLNGRTMPVGYGPARGPKGWFRADEWDLRRFLCPGRNEALVEVSAYNVPNYYLMDQPPFLKAEVVCGGRVVAATKASGGAFAAVEGPRVRKAPRYSFQRGFSEAWRLPAAKGRPPLALAPAPEPALLPRRAPYPEFELDAGLAPVSFGGFRVDDKKDVFVDRALALPGKGGTFRGYALDELEENASFLAQRVVVSGLRPASKAERLARRFPLSAGECAVFANEINDTGFPWLRVVVSRPGRLMMQFDEVLSDDGAVRGVARTRDCNAVVWEFSEPGPYEVMTFEPYTLRYLELDVLSGEMELEPPRFVSYKSPAAKGAAFRSSDPALVKVFDAARETFSQNAVDVFTDCPGRERAGWNCDAYFTGAASMLLTGSGDLERLFLENFAYPKAFDALPEGMLPMCYPSDHPNGSFIPNWALWFTLEAEEYLKRTGDRETVGMLKPRLEKMVEYLWRFRNSDGLLERLPSWVFVEHSHAGDLVQDVSYPSNMTWADALDAMARLYGRKDLAEEAARVRETIRRQSWTGEWFCDNAVRQADGSLKLSGECTETCQYYALFHRVATPETHPRLWRTLLTEFGPSRFDPKDRKRLLKHPEIWPSNAFIGNFLRLKLLEREGRGRQILDETKGYFLYMADRTGTLWENDTTCASCNHGFASYVAALLTRCVLGLDVDHLAKTVSARDADVDLESCGATLPVEGGEVSYDFSRRPDGGRTRSISAPPGWRIVREWEKGGAAAETKEAGK